MLQTRRKCAKNSCRRQECVNNNKCSLTFTIWYTIFVCAGNLLLSALLTESLPIRIGEYQMLKAPNIASSNENDPRFSIDDAKAYLQTYGYLPRGNSTFVSETVATLAKESLTDGLRAFQRFAQIPQSGLLDQATVQMMSAPRCGVEDLGIVSFQDLRDDGRSKRYTIEGSYWGVKDLTYKIGKYTKSLNQEKVESIIESAFKVWEDSSPLTFTRREQGPANIEIAFVRGSHGDGEPFDGRGQILAHAFFPRYGGDVHFDEDESWVVAGAGPRGGDGANSFFDRIAKFFFSSRSAFGYAGIDLYSVAAHEIGHSLGLKHSNNHQALMAPFYHSNTGSAIKLHPDDIKGLQHLYGKFVEGSNKDKSSRSNSNSAGNSVSSSSSSSFGGSSSTTTTDSIVPKTETNSPSFDICSDPSIDAITVLGNGSTYAFKGDLYWKLNQRSYEQGYPRRIVDDWDGLPANVDAAITDADGDTYFFKGDQYWLMNLHGRKYKGYPRKISIGLVDMPDNIDAAMIWNYDEKPYFFKGTQFWQYSRWGMPPSWPRNIKRISPLLPDKIDAAFKWNNGQNYLFTGNVYYRLSSWRIMKVVPGYPRPVGEWWFGCSNKESVRLRRASDPEINIDEK